ncbi:shikimate dehydrogenase family protein [Sediminibacterium soli]|uniref:shikimate dehydrogenase family protein n=1 Tax=Sediminibacterium soli TaxID=2698829 RepID=UPI00137B7BB6|nr:shikimate dehydrogenase [Sediminibacterium soli]NCI47925.1 shikimate dehydrogenase [Sediminibacterium soli]
MRRYGLIGYPLSHSFSKTYFAEKFAKQGIADCVYENYALAGIDELGTLLQQEGLRGLNVTIPYKKQVMPFLQAMTPAVSQMGACNCIDIRNGVLTGHNTDVVGFRQSLLPFLKPQHTHALILGTGGASAAVEYVLNELQIACRYVSRSEGEEAIAYTSLTPDMMRTHLLVINTTPLGMYPNTTECPDIPYELISPEHHLFDLIYNPAETLFLAKGRAKGATVQNGLEMLELQAEESWHIWNSQPV